MRLFFRRGQDLVLAALGIVFAGIIVGSFVWSVQILVGSFESALASQKSGDAQTTFHLDEAKKILTDRGLAP